MKNRRFQYEYRKSASKLHQKVGEILRTTDAFMHHKIYQEYPVNKINDQANSSWHFDWVIEDLKVVIECMGRQHEIPIAFGNEEVEDTIDKFKRQLERDKAKKKAAEDAGYTYIVVGWREEKEIDGPILLSKIYDASSIITNDKEEIDYKMTPQRMRKEYLASDIYKEHLEKSKEHRKERYKQLKKLKDDTKKI